MTILTYWQVDAAAEPARVRGTSPGREGQTLFRDVRTAAINRYDYYAQVARRRRRRLSTASSCPIGRRRTTARSSPPPSRARRRGWR